MNKIKNGWLSQTRKVISPHFDERPSVEDISLLVIHYISLPPEQFGGGYVDDFSKENSIPLFILILKRFINFVCQPIV